MIWLQENWIIAVVGLVVAVVLLWWLFGRSKPDDIASPTVEPAKPAKPLEPVKPEIIAAEPARFKPIEPKPRTIAPPAPNPAAAPIAKAPLTPEPAPIPDPVAAPPPAAPVAMPPNAAAPPKPAAKPAPKKVADKPSAANPAKKAAVKSPPAAPAAEPALAPAPAPTPATKADNLQLLKGVGSKMVTLLSGLGVTSFQQIAAWTDADVAAIDPQLGAFQGRIARDNIVDQAGYLARGDKAGFEAKYGALGGEL